MPLRRPIPSAAQKLAAIAVVRERADRDALGVLNTVAAGSEGEVKAAVATRTRSNRPLAAWQMAQNVWYGISSGLVLLLAVTGLAITFGTMGVINMAGMARCWSCWAPTRPRRPGSHPHPGAASVRRLARHRPAACLPVPGAIGILIERTIIRFLYGPFDLHPLATWGLSLAAAGRDLLVHREVSCRPDVRHVPARQLTIAC